MCSATAIRSILRFLATKNNAITPRRITNKTMAMATGTPTETPIITPRFVVPSPPTQEQVRIADRFEGEYRMIQLAK